MLAAARVTLKQHRFEVTVAALAAVAAAVLGLSIAIRIDGLHVSQACLDQVRASIDGSGIGEGCLSPVRTGTGILGSTYLSGEGSLPLSVMGALPFLLGLLGGVPIVAQEVEARTAQTAWSLNGSRVRWLARQVAPIAVVLGAAMTLAAVVAIPVADLWVRWGYGGASSLIGLHGLLAIVRAFGAFGVGLAVGALLGGRAVGSASASRADLVPPPNQPRKPEASGGIDALFVWLGVGTQEPGRGMTCAGPRESRCASARGSQQRQRCRRDVSEISARLTPVRSMLRSGSGPTGSLID
jgi:hypothetical protein